MFRESKQQVGGFSYRFWIKSVPKLKKYKKKTEPSELSGVEDYVERIRILKAVEAKGRFGLCADFKNYTKASLS